MNGMSAIRVVGETNWRALTYFNAYRFLVAFLFASLYWIGQLPQPLGAHDQALFAGTVHAYILFSLAVMFFIQLQRPPYALQAAAHVVTDIVVITLLMYSSAGLSSGFGMLLVIAVAGGALLIPGKIGILFAAIAAIAVLGHEAYVQLKIPVPQHNYTHAGFLGMTFFFTAIIGSALASRVQESEALARQRAIELHNLAQLNEYIVQHLQSGIAVLDEQLRITLLNGAAGRLLGADNVAVGTPIGTLSPELEESVRNWIRGDESRTVIVRAAHGGSDLQASFSRLKAENRVDVLIFLEDVATLRQRAQQMKLASLGRLTASIAHEVRNPLGAISHAGQLLSESQSLKGDERRLTSIIEEHSRRLNVIIEDIMSISRRNRTQPEGFDMREWLEEFRAEFVRRQQLDEAAMALECEGDHIEARMDPDQLHQVLWNLCENGLRYSRRMPLLRLRCGIRRDSDRPFIDVIDTGPGIGPEAREQLFEPFFTTEADGTGLGLYIARELCEANQATLHLHSTQADGSCFRVTLAHPHRQQVIS
jgi:two-component system sensor histidine kinase PilS (NtrC family)